MSLFEVKNITVSFGGVKALNDVSFTVNKGEIFTIIGPNGAGKSTLFNVISRIYEPSNGEIFFDGENISKIKPHNISSLGIARTFQNLELFENATVLQNMLLGRHIYKKTNILSEILCGLIFEIFSPSKKISPLLGSYILLMTLKRVDLPAPFGPMIVNISPLSTVKETSFNAFTPPKETVMFLTSNKLIKLYPIS